eukprot:sb/3477188/
MHPLPDPLSRERDLAWLYQPPPIFRSVNLPRKQDSQVRGYVPSRSDMERFKAVATLRSHLQTRVIPQFKQNVVNGVTEVISIGLTLFSEHVRTVVRALAWQTPPKAVPPL